MMVASILAACGMLHVAWRCVVALRALLASRAGSIVSLPWRALAEDGKMVWGGSLLWCR